jgi:hypothetical protein
MHKNNFASNHFESTVRSIPVSSLQFDACQVGMGLCPAMEEIATSVLHNRLKI